MVPDAMIACVGGAVLISGLSLFTDAYNKSFKINFGIYGVEPDYLSSKTSLEKRKSILQIKRHTFVDGASVAQVGQLNFDKTKKNKDKKSIFSVKKIKSVMKLSSSIRKTVYY